MKRSSTPRLSPQTVRLAALIWMGLVAVAGMAVFAILMITLSNRSERLARAEPTATPTVRPQVVVTVTSSMATDSPSPDGTATPTLIPTPSTVGLPESGLELGGQVPGYIAHRDVMVSAGMTWVKYQIKWNPATDITQAQQNIAEGHSNGFKVLLSISGDPYPQQPIDYASYIAYLTEVARLKPDAIEIWNEMNLDREWPRGQFSPADYVNNMLAPAYRAIKAVSPQTSVIIGALAPTGVDDMVIAMADQRYVQGLYAAGAANYADCIGVHHNSGTTAPSVRSGRPEGNHYSWYFLPTIEVYYNGMNGALPVCLTEFGYVTPEGFDTPIPSNFAWGADNTVAEQAAWLAEGVDLAQQLGYVRLVIIWNVDFTKWEENDPQGGYAILRPDGTCPACAALYAALNN